MKKFVLIVIGLLIGVCNMAYGIDSNNVAEAAIEQKVGNSDYGIMYIYPDTVEAVKRMINTMLLFQQKTVIQMKSFYQNSVKERICKML